MHAGHDHGSHAGHRDHAGHGNGHAAGAPQTPDTTGGAGSTLDLLAFTGWDAALAVGALVALGVLWLAARRGAAPARRTIPPVAVLSLAVATLAASSPVGSLVSRGSHLAFMVQLELLMNVVPVLLLFAMLPFLRSAVARPGRVAGAPALGLGAWVLVMYASHLPVVHGLIMGSRAAYALLLLAFVGAGLLFWTPVIAGRGMQAAGKLGYLALAQAGAGLLAAVLIWSPMPLYAHGSGDAPFGLSALLDQRLSGAVMMVVDMLVASAVAGWIFIRSLDDARRPSPAAE